MLLNARTVSTCVTTIVVTVVLGLVPMTFLMLKKYYTLSRGVFSSDIQSYLASHKNCSTLDFTPMCVVATFKETKVYGGIKFYIVLTANSYELARRFYCIDTVSFKSVKFKTYDAYVKYVCKTRKYKDER